MTEEETKVASRALDNLENLCRLAKANGDVEMLRRVAALAKRLIYYVEALERHALRLTSMVVLRRSLFCD